jgi:D-alanyl-D-alanine carboxypeptidase
MRYASFRYFLGAMVVVATNSCLRADAQTAGTIEPKSLLGCIASYAENVNFSGAVLVEGAGRISTFARGVTAGPGSPPITVDTRFDLGSSSKMFTAVAVAQLLEAKKVHLDDAIGHYVDGLTPEASAVTVRELLSHTSGLGDFFKPEVRAKIEKAHALRDLVPLVASEKPAFQPGSQYHYSNTGYLLLGMMIERVSGQRYSEYLQSKIFLPPHMLMTSLDPGPESGRAIGMTAMLEAAQQTSGPPNGPQYRSFSDQASPDGSLRPAQATLASGNPAGAMFSTIGDMQRFFSSLLKGKLISLHLESKFVSPHAMISRASKSQAEIDYGFGFGMGSFDGHRWFGHAGGLPGANTETNVFPDDDVVIIVLSNRDPPAASILYSDVRAAIFNPPEGGGCPTPEGH